MSREELKSHSPSNAKLIRSMFRLIRIALKWETRSLYSLANGSPYRIGNHIIIDTHHGHDIFLWWENLDRGFETLVGEGTFQPKEEFCIDDEDCLVNQIMPELYRLFPLEGLADV